MDDQRLQIVIDRYPDVYRFHVVSRHPWPTKHVHRDVALLLGPVAAVVVDPATPHRTLPPDPRHRSKRYGVREWTILYELLAGSEEDFKKWRTTKVRFATAPESTAQGSSALAAFVARLLQEPDLDDELEFGVSYTMSVAAPEPADG